jgi:transposase
VDIFPNDASITRLVGAMMLEQKDEWSLNQRDMQLEGPADPQRYTLVKFTTCEDAATLCASLREAFDYFCGVPEQVLFDNTKAVAIDRGACDEGVRRWNDELRRLAETGIRARLSPEWQEQQKGPACGALEHMKSRSLCH